MAGQTHFEIQRAATAQNHENLSETGRAAFPECDRDWLAWYAELRYQTCGGGKCSLCRTPVRHALKVRAERTDGSTRTYVCLCTRCLIAEEALSTRVLYLVAGRWTLSRQPRERTARPAHKQAA
jgi:hypothetical protein